MFRRGRLDETPRRAGTPSSVVLDSESCSASSFSRSGNAAPQRSPPFPRGLKLTPQLNSPDHLSLEKKSAARSNGRASFEAEAAGHFNEVSLPCLRIIQIEARSVYVGSKIFFPPALDVRLYSSCLPPSFSREEDKGPNSSFFPSFPSKGDFDMRRRILYPRLSKNLQPVSADA